MPKETAQAPTAPTKEELRADAEALAAKIKSVPNYEKDEKLKYALREINNAFYWLGGKH